MTGSAPTPPVALKACPHGCPHDEFDPSVSKSQRYAEPGDPDKGTFANLAAGLVDAGFYVECGICGACGGHRDTEAEAIAAWNQRATPDAAAMRAKLYDLRDTDFSRSDSEPETIPEWCNGYRAGVEDAIRALPLASTAIGEDGGDAERSQPSRNVSVDARGSDNRLAASALGVEAGIGAGEGVVSHAIRTAAALCHGAMDDCTTGRIVTVDPDDFDALNAALDQVDADDHSLVPDVAAMKDALAWYGEQARLARLVHSGGDDGRHNLAEDGGKRARAILGDAK